MSSEARVISAVLNDKQIFAVLQSNPEDLFRTHKDIWNFIKDYYEQNKSLPSPTLVQNQFSDFIYTKDVGATKYEIDLLRREFLDDNVRGMLRTAATEVQNGNPLKALDVVTSETARIKRVTSTARDLDAADIDSAVAYFEMIQELNELGEFGIFTGLKGFDDFLPNGITPGQLGIFLAYPGIGKSWLALYFAVQAWKRGKSPLIVSLEMSEEEVRNRIFTIVGQGLWSHRKLSSGKVERDLLRKWMEKEFKGRPSFRIISNDGIGEMNPTVLRGKIDQHHPDIVFVDYLNLMSPNQRADSETVRVKNLSRELKLLAGSESIPIVAIASATAGENTDMSLPPTMDQVRWSKDVAYDADWMLALGRPMDSDIIQLVFRKNRNGFLGDFMLQVDFDKGFFVYKDFA